MPERMFRHAESHPVRNTVLSVMAFAGVALGTAVWGSWPEETYDQRVAVSLQLTAYLLADHVAHARQSCGKVYESTAGREMFVPFGGREVRVAISKNLDGQPVSTSVTVRDGALYRTLAYPDDFSVHGGASWQSYQGVNYPIYRNQYLPQLAKIQAEVAHQCGLISASEFAQLTSHQIAVQ